MVYSQRSSPPCTPSTNNARHPYHCHDHQHPSFRPRPSSWHGRRRRPRHYRNRSCGIRMPGETRHVGMDRRNRQSRFRCRLPTQFSLSTFDDRQDIQLRPDLIPRTTTPKSREKTFTEIMNGTFDRKKSPFSFGKKIFGAASDNYAERSFPNSFDSSCNLNHGNAALFSPAPARPRKRLASAEIGPSGKLTKPHFSSLDSDSPVAPGNQTRDTASSRTASNEEPPPFLELNHLTTLIQRNIEVSKELTDLLLKRMRRIDEMKEEDFAASSEIERNRNRFMISTTRSEVQAYMAALVATGGESPDPPPDNGRAVRGHMIDCVLRNSNRSSTEEISESPSSVSIEVKSGTTKATSASSLTSTLPGQPDLMDTTERLHRTRSPAGLNQSTSNNTILPANDLFENHFGDTVTDDWAFMNRLSLLDTPTSPSERPYIANSSVSDPIFIGPTSFDLGSDDGRKNRFNRAIERHENRTRYAPSPESLRRRGIKIRSTNAESPSPGNSPTHKSQTFDESPDRGLYFGWGNGYRNAEMLGPFPRSPSQAPNNDVPFVNFPSLTLLGNNAILYGSGILSPFDLSLSSPERLSPFVSPRADLYPV